VSGGTLLVNRGGKGANQAMAARRLGADVRLLACVGDDAAGREIRGALAGEGIDVAGVATTSEAATGTALIVVDPQGRNQIAVAPGANRRLRGETVQGRRADFEWADVVVCQLETPIDTVAWVLGEARRRGVATLLNPAPVPDAPLDFWDLVDCVTPNAGEAERLTGLAVADAAGAEAAGQALCARGVGRAVVTLGEAGAVACSRAGTLRVPAYRVEAIDTTAAGDAFNGALAVGMARRVDIAEALRLAAAAAALACTRRGAQASLPSAAEVQALLSAGA
jgi:ribokinase